MQGAVSGSITITKVRGKDLPAEDVGGTSDPYFVIKCVTVLPPPSAAHPAPSLRALCVCDAPRVHLLLLRCSASVPLSFP